MELRVRRPEHVLVLALLVSLLLWSVPFGGFVLYPFKLLSTWVHEMWHGVAMMVTGAGFSRLEIFRDTSGLAFPERGSGGLAVAAIASAGYMGTAMLGSFLLVLSQRWHRPRLVLVGLAVAFGLSLLLWVRNDFGQGVVAIGVIALLLLARFAPARISFFLANFVAAQACINAVLDIRVLFRPVLVIDDKIVQISDAQTMAAATFGPPALWAGFWMAWSFFCFYVAFRLTFVRRAA
jgi:Peptidase M50B-like